MITVNVPPGVETSHYYFSGRFNPYQPRLQDGALVLDIQENHFRMLLASEKGPLWSAANIELHRQLAAGDMASSQVGMR